MARNPTHNIDAVAIEVAEKQRKSLELRKAGASYDDIAKAVGYEDRSGAYRAVQRAFTGITKELAEEVLTLELERLDQVLLPMLREARKGNQGAVDRVLRIMERRARYLSLDAPIRTHIEGDLTVNYTLAIDGLDDTALT